MVCSTIHGFAQALIKPYPVEAGIDPGAEIIDPAEADLAFGELYEAWLRDHLSGRTDDDIVAELVLADEGQALGLLRSIADFRRRNRDARPADAAWSTAAGDECEHAVSNLMAALNGIGFGESDTEAAAADFAQLVSTLTESRLCSERPTNRALVAALSSPRPQTCFTRTGSRRKLQTKGKWERAARAVGRSKTAGTEAFDTVSGRYLACHDAREAFMASAAGEVLGRVVEEMNGLLADWRAYKHAAALLDFDDLIYTARDLLTGHEQVREALARRYRHVLVDEFQDTDPLQIEILWQLCGEPENEGSVDCLDRTLRPGALFLVGDPKQAIYQFRGADVNAYIGARTAISGSGRLNIAANFRSVEPILSFVNDKFEAILSIAAGQPGFTQLLPTCEAQPGLVAVAALDVADGEDPTAETVRDAEAKRVAELCRQLVGNQLVRGRNGEMRPCQFGDIALLAPVGTELWQFEEALEGEGIGVSTQAGKGFFRRQEVQDLIALARTLADGRDTLALGALLRGPLVGLTEAELLDVADALPLDPDHPDILPQLNLWTDPEEIRHDLARSVVRSLQSLAKRARSTTPYALLSDAIGLLNIRSQLRQRFKAGTDRALANTDVFLEMSRAYAVRGLRAFASDMRSNWEEAVRQVEGRPDAEEQSVSLTTIHAAKGLEWPIVIPINMTGSPKAESGLMHDRRSKQFSIPIFGIEAADYVDIKAWNVEELARERVRLWYVAATRARDLLVLPRHSFALKQGAYANIVDFDLPSLDIIDPAKLGGPMPIPPAPPENAQTRDQFAEEAATSLDLSGRSSGGSPAEAKRRSPSRPIRANFPRRRIGRGGCRTAGRHSRRQRDERDHPAQTHGGSAKRRNRGQRRYARRPRPGAHGSAFHLSVRSSQRRHFPGRTRANGRPYLEHP